MKVRTSIYLDSDKFKELTKEAKELNLSLSEYLASRLEIFIDDLYFLSITSEIQHKALFFNKEQDYKWHIQHSQFQLHI